MIREWCSHCGQRYEVTWPTFGVTGCPKDCDSLDFGDVGFAVADANAEIFWTAIAHERAKFTSTNGWCDACGERACGCHTDPSEKGNG